MEPILRVEDLHIHYLPREVSYFTRQKKTFAVRGITFEIVKGETFAIVGESGSGKTTVLMSILRFIKPAKGLITFQGSDIWNLTDEEWLKLRRLIQPVFQNASDSLNPRMKVGRAVEDGLWFKNLEDRKLKRKELLKLFFAVDLGEEHLDYYPFQLSGGQKQRVCIARSLAAEPELLILDEPISAQDLSVQAHLINLLSNLKQQQNLTYLLISHDLKIVRALAQRIAVMKDGVLVEVSDKETIFNHPKHPYTRLLLGSSDVSAISPANLEVRQK